MEQSHVPVITIDGPSGTGKGTISHKLAKQLHWNYLDSGALYRIAALAAQKKNLDFENLDALLALINSLEIKFCVDDKMLSHVLLEQQDVTDEIRTEHCGQDASYLASIPQVRKALLNRQREFAKPPGLVTDGRDMGTVVFPNAILKIYLYATAEERALRRYLQLKEKENDVSLAQVVEELSIRDERDTERKHSPLKPASDAIQMDTTKLTIVQVFNDVLQLAKKRLSVSTQ